MARSRPEGKEAPLLHVVNPATTEDVAARLKYRVDFRKSGDFSRVNAAGGWGVVADHDNERAEVLMEPPSQQWMIDRLRDAGLRPTRQRIALAELLFGRGDRHVSAELLHDEAAEGGHQISLATIYNTLHQFTRVGLLRELAIDGTKSYFDTNVSNHSHFFLEDSGELVDIPNNSLRVMGLPDPPAGTEIRHIDVVVRVGRAVRRSDGS